MTPPNPAECLILRSLYKQGIQWRGEESIDKAIEQLKADKRLPDLEIDKGKILMFANMTETPPPTRAKVSETNQDKMERLAFELFKRFK